MKKLIKRLLMSSLLFSVIPFFLISCSHEDGKEHPVQPVPSPPISQDDFPFSGLGSGRILYESEGFNFGGLILADIDRKTITKFSLDGLSSGYRLSPTGELMAYHGKTDLINHEYGIFVASSTGLNPKRLIPTHVNGFNPGWSPDGSKIFFWSQVGTITGEYQLKSVDKSGTNLTVITTGKTNLKFSSPSVSMSGKIVFSTNDRILNSNGASGIYIFDPVNQKIERIILNENGKFIESPAFSPDGSKIAFLQVTRPIDEYQLIEIVIWDIEEKIQKVVLSVNASGSEEYNFPDFGNQVNLAWSPDGSKIIFNVPEGDLTSHLYVVNSTGSGLNKITNGINTTDFKVSWGR